MKRFGPVSVKRLFRREPVVSTVVTAGTVNVLLGTLEGQAILAFLGVLVVSGAIVLRSWQRHRRPVSWPENPPVRYLPDRTARPPMPMLGLSRRDTPEQ